MRLVFSLGICGLLLAGFPALAQDGTPRQAKASAPRRASDLLDASVMQNGRVLGRITDLMLSDSGRVQHLIVRTDRGLVLLPFTSVRYDSDERAYALAAGVTPRPLSQASNLDEPVRPSPGDRFARAGRLVRTETPAPARLEREPALIIREPVVDDRPGYAMASLIYSEPSFSVSVTRNIDRLPRRHITAYDNYTMPSEADGRRSFLRLPPPPAYAR